MQTPARPLDAFVRLEQAAARAPSSPLSRLKPPTQAEAEADAYLKPPFHWNGLVLQLENVRNSVRSGTSEDGKAWSNRMAAHYGEIAGTVGADGDPLDVFVGMFPESRAVWVINQGWPDGGFDEHKLMLGFVTEQQAREAYLMSFDRDWTGLQSMVPCTVPQLLWWVKHGNKARPFTLDQLPFDPGHDDMNATPWDANAEPAGVPMHQLMYNLRTHDPGSLLLDAACMDDIMRDPDVQAWPLFDALVVEVNRMTQKMDLLLRVMQASAGEVKAEGYTISDPIKARGVMQVAVLFAMSDGQSVIVWFHNPDTTPAKLMPLDELISWKWMLNKKDITIVVAPEKGADLNVREVARRVMRLVERNAPAFAKANANLAARKEEELAIDAEIVDLTGQLASLETRIAVERERQADAVAAAAREAARPFEERVTEALMAQHQWRAETRKAGKAKSLMKSLPGLALAGELSDGSRTVSAVWADGYRSLRLAFGWDDVLSMAAGGDPLDFAVEFNRRVEAWAEGERAKLAPKIASAAAPDSAAAEALAPAPEPAGDAAPTADQAPTAEAASAEVPTAAPDLGPAAAAEPADEATPVAATEPIEPLQVEAAADPAAQVDAAYLFADATDAFKQDVADSLGQTEYSPFATAKAMDEAARAHGLTIAWDVTREPLLDATVEGAARETAAESKAADDAAPAEGDGEHKPAADAPADEAKPGPESGEAENDKEDDDTDAEAEFEGTPAGDDEDEKVLDGDFPGHPFRGNQFKTASRASGAAVESSMRAKHAERKGDRKGQASAHRSAYHAHSAAAEGATGKAKAYHSKMAAFHGKRGGVVLDAVQYQDAPLLDDAGQEYDTIKGLIRKDEAVAGRAYIAGDGKAMVYVGAEGSTRVRFATGTRAMWSDDDAADMIVSLAASLTAPTDAAPTEAAPAEAAPAEAAPAEAEPVEAEPVEAAQAAEVPPVETPAAAEAPQAPTEEPNVHDNYIRIAADSIADLRKVDVDRVIGAVAADNADGVSRDSLGAWISQQRPDLAGEVADVLAELAASTPAAMTAEPPAVPAAAATPAADNNGDRAFLERVIAGAEPLSAEVFERMEPMFTAYEGDADMLEVLERAAAAYGDAAAAAAQAALAA